MFIVQVVSMFVFGLILGFVLVVVQNRYPRTRAVILVFLGMVVGWLLATIVTNLIADLLWCVEQYGNHSIVGHCMWYENLLFGRFIQP